MKLEFDKQTLQELNQIKASLQALSPGIQSLMYGDMTYAAAREFVKKAKASPRFTDKSGATRKSFRVIRIDVTDDRTGKEIHSGGAQAVMGGRRAPQAHLLEWGTANRTQNTTGRRTGQVQPKLILTNAFETSQNEAARAGVKAAQKTFKKVADYANNKGKLTKRQVRVIGGQ